MHYTYLEPSQVPPQLRAGYSGKAFKACAVTEYTINGQDGVWDHGTRTTHNLIRLSDGKQLPMIDHNLAPWDSARKDIKVTLDPGFVIVKHSMFQGKDLGLTFYVHPDNIAALLPPASEALTVPEKQMLYVFRALISRARKEELARGGFDTRTYDSVLASLQSKGLIDPNRAITVKGRNAAEGLNYTVFPSKY